MAQKNHVMQQIAYISYCLIHNLIKSSDILVRITLCSLYHAKIGAQPAREYLVKDKH